MSALVSRLAGYGAYHRNGHNIATHMIGIPLIVFAVAVLASRPAIGIGPAVVVTPAMLISAAAACFYLRLDLRFGLAMAALLALATWAGLSIAALPTAWWLAIGLGSFVVGWALQFLGHYYEGRKPAFIDDVSGLIVGPLFVLAEAAFLLGLRLEVRQAMRADAARAPTPVRG